MKEALERGFAIQARRTQAITNDGDFELTRNEGGFSLTPKEFTGHENEHRFSLHFGKAPPDPEE
ncbi:MAG TPA: hypothetical protein VJ952_10855 [Opitutales bacterium]|nr:hypothetical protein [Opitutales bacterium]